MTRKLAAYRQAPHGRTLMGGEPLVFHCNFYNYWLQKTLLLDDSLSMSGTIRDAGAETVHAILLAAAKETRSESREARRTLAQDTFSELGFGLADLSQLTNEGGEVIFPMSHYGAALRQACGVDFAVPQSHFDAGFSAAAASFLANKPLDYFVGEILECQSMGAPRGRVHVSRRQEGVPFTSKGLNTHVGNSVPAPHSSNVDEAGILQALSGLDLSGNEEGLIPKFGLVLTNHMANFYNRISFEFLRKMGKDMIEAAELLLLDTGYRCAFHTFGGIMKSEEWDAVIRPQLKNTNDWVHGMTATVNALGWGTWRIAELSEKRIVMRIYDDYESCGYLEMYGKATRPISLLAQAGVEGMMNVIHIGEIHKKPELSLEYYAQIFERQDGFTAEQTKNIAMGDEYTEIVATRG